MIPLVSLLCIVYYLLHNDSNAYISFLCINKWGGRGCKVSCGGHHRLRGKTTTGSALDWVLFDMGQILAYLVHNMIRSQIDESTARRHLKSPQSLSGRSLHLTSVTIILLFLPFGLTPSLFRSIAFLAGLWLNCISSVEITLFLLADILLQHRALFQC